MEAVSMPKNHAEVDIEAPPSRRACPAGCDARSSWQCDAVAGCAAPAGRRGEGRAGGAGGGALGSLLHRAVLSFEASGSRAIDAVEARWARDDATSLSSAGTVEEPPRLHRTAITFESDGPCEVEPVKEEGECSTDASSGSESTGGSNEGTGDDGDVAELQPRMSKRKARRLAEAEARARWKKRRRVIVCLSFAPFVGALVALIVVMTTTIGTTHYPPGDGIIRSGPAVDRADKVREVVPEPNIAGGSLKKDDVPASVPALVPASPHVPTTSAPERDDPPASEPSSAHVAMESVPDDTAVALDRSDELQELPVDSQEQVAASHEYDPYAGQDPDSMVKWWESRSQPAQDSSCVADGYGCPEDEGQCCGGRCKESQDTGEKLCVTEKDSDARIR
ncbi:hypothetical protein ACHAWF_003688 [Thalassiosira exigua]